MKRKIDGVEEKRKAVLAQSTKAAIDQQHQRGKLTARERIERLVDRGSFVELDTWAAPVKTGFDIDKRELYGDAGIIGYGEVNKRPVFLYAHDFTILGGTVGLTNHTKYIKLMEKAAKMGYPVVNLVDSGGARIYELFSHRAQIGPYQYDHLMFWHTRLSGFVPQISLMMGPCYAGPAYSPALTDFVLMVKGTSHMAIASPGVLKAVLFEDVSEDDLGGAMMHATVSGCCDLVLDDDGKCIDAAKELLGFLPSNNREKAPRVPTNDSPDRQDEALLSLSESSTPFDSREVVKRLADEGHFFELKPDFGKGIATGFARLNGDTVGFVANNSLFGSLLDTDACDKMARFVRFCDCFGITLVFLVDNPVYPAGNAAEAKGLVRHAAKAVYAICEATVPKITVHMRQCFGPGILATSNEAMQTDLVLGWPSARVAVTDPEKAIDAIFRQEIESAPNPDEVREKRLKEFTRDYGEFPYYSAYLRLVNDIIDPRQTRSILIRSLKLVSSKKDDARPAREHGVIPL